MLAVAASLFALVAPAHATACGSYYVPATIGGRRVCLHEGMACRRRVNRAYHRYGFECAGSYLRVWWRGLEQRPLRLPRVEPGSPCPAATPAGTLGDRGNTDTRSAPAFGPGPAYPALPIENGRATLPYLVGWGYDGWDGTKLLWTVPRYRGAVIVRGGRIDGTGELRFDQGPQWSGKLHVDLRFFGPETSLHPAATFLKAPGCYAYQVDGLRFSYHVVFAARVAARELASAGWSWRSLHRPLHVPRIAPGTRCPVSKKTYASIGDVARLLPGPGPAYPDAGGGNATLEFFWPPLPSQADFYGSGWSGNKVLWWVDTTYAGPVLIRGRQLDGPHLLRFDTGAPPPAEIRIAPKRHAAPNRIGSARDRPSYTRVESPGCYGYQIDGVGFSRVIVFGAKVVPPPP